MSLEQQKENKPQSEGLKQESLLLARAVEGFEATLNKAVEANSNPDALIKELEQLKISLAIHESNWCKVTQLRQSFPVVTRDNFG